MYICENCFKQYDEQYDICPFCGEAKGSENRAVYLLPVGTLLHGQYIIGKCLGMGGFAITYKGWDIKLNRYVAIKESFISGVASRVPETTEVILYNKNRSKEFYAQIQGTLNEARNTQSFNGENNIVQIYDFFEENNTAYYVMEYLDGMTLKKYLEKNGGVLDEDEAVSIIRKVAYALEKVHEKKFLHRDISPDNIYICKDGRVVLFDFGAARFYKGQEELSLILKPGYAPPEQYAKTNKQGEWTDIYALGATLYHLVTGEKPDESINRKVEDIIKPPYEINPSVNVNLGNIIMKAMAVESHMRFQKVTEFRKALQNYKKKKFVTLKHEKLMRNIKRAVGIAAAVLIVAVAFIRFSFLWEKQKEEETLPTETIALWCIDDDGSVAENMEAIIEHFKESYDNVTIQVTAFSKEEYIVNLQAAIENGQAPELFETSGIDDKYLASAQDMSGIVKEYFKDNCFFYSQYAKAYYDYKHVPLGFNYKLVYVNNVIYRELYGETYSKSSEKNIQSIIENGDYDALVTDEVEEFLSSGYMVLDGSSADYMKVADSLSGRYQLVVIENQSFVADGVNGFTYEWSIITSDKDKQKVAEKFLEYLLSPYGQDMLEINPNRSMLPLNRSVFLYMTETFSEYSELYEKINR